MASSISNKSSRSRSSSGSGSRTSSGGSSSKKRDQIRRIKQVFWLGLYGVIMVLSVRKMMNEQLVDSFWYDLAAFGLLWIYRALATAKITTVLRISVQWFVAHALVILVHLAVVLFFNEPSPADVIQSSQVHKEQPSAPVVQPYQVGE
jgi:lysylphosphatidylglycerol synthetase-like protein (DUF2156 family)